MRILFIGDIVASTGLRTLKALLPKVTKRYAPDLVIANGENAAKGFGITPANAKSIFACGVDFITTGNHVWDKREIFAHIDKSVRMIRPANFTKGVPGRGWQIIEAAGKKVGVVNLVGRVFMPPSDNPFTAADEAVVALKEEGSDYIIVDFHAEATSEKAAMGHHLDGRVSAVVGTHTHVPTADATVLPGGTGFISDVGMTGVRDSVIGISKEKSVKRFITGLPYSAPSAEGRGTLMAVLFTLAKDGSCESVVRVEESETS